MSAKFLTLSVLCGISILSATVTSTAADVDVSKLPPAAAKKNLSFEKDVKPIFEKNNCFKCHGSEKQKGKLRLDSLETVLKGGENAPNIVKGDSAKSSLIHAIARLNDDEAMPPAKKDGTFTAVTKEDIGIIRAWIDQGAK